MRSQISSDAIWRHPFPKTTRLDAFRRHINRKYKLNLETYGQLHKWSIDELETFNEEIWTVCGLTYSVPPSRVADGLDKMWPPPNWFPGAMLNYSENLLAVGLATHPDAIAISSCREGGTEWRHLSWRELRQQAELYACAMVQAGVRKGDRIAAVATNSIEAVLLLLAAGWVGAIFSSTAPDMGVNGIVERFVQIQPKILFIESAVQYALKKLDFRSKFEQVIEELDQRVSSLTTVVDLSNQVWNKCKVVKFSDFAKVKTSTMAPVQVPFDHPIYILYSSGTTGAPKCICHAGGRAILQQKKEYILGTDIGPDSVYYQYTTTGWMMWNYLAGALSTGARIVLYDGSPMHPTPFYQLQLLQEQGVTHWGTSPKFLTSLKQEKDVENPYPLDNLQYVIVSGSPLSHELCDWFYSWSPKHVGLFSASGGTDLVAGIVGANTMASIHKGELAAANLGMKVEIFDTEGKNIEWSGEKGDLVITRPFLSMPVTFWGRDGMEKYRKAYFDEFPGVWNHGDFIRRNPRTGGYEILGRSDGVLNPGGVRFGTAEIYGIVDKFSQVEDYIAVGQRRDHDTDEQVLLFLKMKSGSLDAQLRKEIASMIRSLLSPRHVPAYILQVKDIPYTMNGKRIEHIVRDTVCGRPAKIGGTAVNPECLEEYRQFLKLPQSIEKSRL